MPEEKLTYAEKEHIAASKVTVDDMKQFNKLPYKFGNKIEKWMKGEKCLFAYINLNSYNRFIARRDLRRINDLIKKSYSLSNSIPRNLLIPTEDLCFNYSDNAFYTRLVCQPYTVDGELSFCPAFLHFTNTDEIGASQSVHGIFYYGQNGKIINGKVCFWNNHIGYFFHLSTVNDELIISVVFKSGNGEIHYERLYGNTTLVALYKAKHILALEAKMEKEEQDYEWIKKNFHDKCPKTLTGFRRIKTMNTKNYKILKSFAAAHNREI